MSDRFEFRVWDKKHKTYECCKRFGAYFIDQCGDLLFIEEDKEDGCWIQDSENFIVEQCTGLKDKNGNLIYEGDLLGTSKDDEEFIEICWCDTLASFMCDIFPETYGNLETCHADYLAKFEIIGNIHEMER